MIYATCMNSHVKHTITPLQSHSTLLPLYMFWTGFVAYDICSYWWAICRLLLDRNWLLCFSHFHFPVRKLISLDAALIYILYMLNIHTCPNDTTPFGRYILALKTWLVTKRIRFHILICGARSLVPKCVITHTYWNWNVEYELHLVNVTITLIATLRRVVGKLVIAVWTR